jgi:hypothetical protein
VILHRVHYVAYLAKSRKTAVMCAKRGCPTIRFAVVSWLAFALCTRHEKERSAKAKAAAERAHRTLDMRGTRIAAVPWKGPPLPPWLIGDRKHLRTRRGVALDARGVPVVIVHTHTLQVVQWVTPAELEKLWRKHARSDGEQLEFGFSSWILSSEDVVESGVHPWELT